MRRGSRVKKAELLAQPWREKSDASRLAVITSHFNFASFERPRVNLRRFLAHMEDCGVPVFGMEAHLRGTRPETEGLAGWFQVEVGPEAMLWQKEALLNAVEKVVPANYEMLAWVDADLEFSDLEWPKMASAALQSMRVVQLFTRCHWLNRAGERDRSRESCVRRGLNKRWDGYPGFAWAARRSLWRSGGGLYDLAAVGGGDTCLAAALLAEDPVARLNEIRSADGGGLDVEATRQMFGSWARTFREWHGQSCGYLACDIEHHWHGDWQARRYVDRCAWMRGFDASREVVRTEDGPLQWTALADPERLALVKCYFAGRDEDGDGTNLMLPPGVTFSPGWAALSPRWLAARVVYWLTHVKPHVGNRAVRWCEVGSHEGRSALCTLKFLLTHPGSHLTCIDDWIKFGPETSARFDANIAVAGESPRVTKIKEDWRTAIPKLTGPFDGIYIDAEHEAIAVKQQAELLWPLLAPGGFIIFDDYGLAPVAEGAIAWLSQLPVADVVHEGWQLIVRKR